MRLIIICISLSIVLIACQSEPEGVSEEQVQEMSSTIESQQEQIQALQLELEEKTRELQQERQKSSEEQQQTEESEQDHVEEEVEQTSNPQTENFELHSPQQNTVITDRISIEGMIHVDAVNQVELEIVDHLGETIEHVEIDDDWFGDLSSDFDWTGIELNMTMTEQPSSGEGYLHIHDLKANEERSVPIIFE
ncbi:Tfp pilus assembly protein PilP [Alkalibacillus filiformis]|uniref:Tfp pilus assembly protein PilP n=1 Tax=Alkalibacillus filiformis TaxID=200990 RepID=A0ABU0DPM9_9BACI|nr:hypothetical protein [Alkalibacillus filiformis]MDQ0350261.1 Tfp pilus assembly protein PilP [Alkalibacillus filiformis]